MAETDAASERTLQGFVNGLVPFIREVIQDVLAEEFDLGFEMGRDTESRSKNATAASDGRQSGGQGRVKDPGHDKRLKENQADETPYQKYSAASKQEIRRAREKDVEA